MGVDEMGSRRSGTTPRNCTSYVAKKKALISFGVTLKLICVFVFAYLYAKSWFSHDEAQMVWTRRAQHELDCRSMQAECGCTEKT